MRARVLSAVTLFGFLCIFSLTVTADDPKVKLPNNIIPSAFRAFLVTDGRFPPVKTPDGKEQPDPRNRAGKIHCLVCENGLAPVIAVFVRLHGPASATLAPDKGVADLVTKANRLISDPKYRANKLAAFVMFLRLESGTKDVTVKTIKDKTEVETKVKEDLEFPDEDDLKRAEYVEDIKKFASALNAPNVPFGLAAEKSKALTEWGVDDKDDVSVVVYYRMRKVGEAWKFKNAADLTDEKVNEILKATVDVLSDKKP